MENEPQRQILLKLVFAGKHGAGKTSLLTREATNQFTEQWLATIGVDFRIKTYKVGNINVKAQIWDTAGQQRFRSIQRPYFKGASAILLCFNLGDRNSFQTLSLEVEEIKSMDIGKCKVYLVGCKSDLQPQIFTDQILIFSERNGCSYFQTSAKQNQGVHECFEAIVKQCTQIKLEEMAFLPKQIKMDLKEKSSSGPIKKTCC